MTNNRFSGQQTLQNVPKCPKCGSPMRKRNGKFGEFWGCSTFPTCKGTRNLADVEPEPIRDGKVWKGDAFNKIQSIDLAQAELKAAALECDPFPIKLAQGEGAIITQLPDKVKIKKLTKREALAAKMAKTIDVPEPAKPEKAKVWSTFQNDIFDWVDTSKPGEAVVVEACAGSGKTTTGAEAAKHLPKDVDAVFVVFNAHNVPPMAAKLPKHIKAKTYHSLGLAACRTQWRNARIVENDNPDEKVEALMEQVLDRFTNYQLFPAIKQLVSLVKNTLSDTTPAALEALTEYHGIELNGDADDVFAAVELVVELSKQQIDLIDFDDMCWLPIAHNLKCHQYDFLVVDEAQDTNKCQMALAIRSIKDTGRIMAVGDRYQSLYGFRGADVDAIPNLIEGLNAKTLPLSITYRCPKAVVRLVNQTFPEIPFHAADTAIEGKVETITELTATVMYTPGDMVLCRTNAPLVSPAFALIRRGVKAIIRGREIGKGLNALIRKMRTSSVIDLLVKLEDYRAKEVAKLTAAKKTNQAQSINDKVDTIVALSDGCSTISEVEDKIGMIFSDTNVGVVFSSVHKAKGLEAKRVFVLHPELMPHPMAKQEWEKTQERNIQYVAYTRALEELYIVNGG